jgi:hypothetical protein
VYLDQNTLTNDHKISPIFYCFIIGAAVYY